MSVSDRVRHETKKIVFEDHLELGYNYRMTDIQAAVGIKQLAKLDWIVSERRKLAAFYHKGFENLPFIQLLLEEEGYFGNYQSYSIYLRAGCPISRNNLMQKLWERGISSRRGIMTSHRETAYRKYAGEVVLPVSEDLQDHTVILPLYVPMNVTEIEFIIDTVSAMVKGDIRKVAI
jgi:dTDP-4-amino-4,6-dideoxygalactose transaminase